MKSNDKIVINTKTLIWIGLFTLFIVMTLVILNSIDNNRRLKEFMTYQNKTKNSQYTSEITLFTKDFYISDYETTEKIKELLENFTQENNGIHDVTLIYFKDGYYYYIYPWSEIKTRKNLRFEEKQFIDTIENSTDAQEDKALYALNDKSDHTITSMIKLEHSYLKYSYNRK